MILEPGKKDKYHRDILVDKPKLIRAKKWNGKFQREPKGFFLIKVEDGWIKAGRLEAPLAASNQATKDDSKDKKVKW